MRAMVLAGVVLIGLGGCAKKQGSESGNVAAAAAAVPNKVSFTAKEYAFEGPDTIPSGMTTLVMTNAGTMLHHLQLVRLTDGKTVEDLKAGLAQMKPNSPPPPWMVFAGGVNAADPGKQTQATLMIEPGNYAIVCLVDVPDHVPHMMKGMVKGLTVTPSTAAPAPAPASDLSVTLVDYAFSFATAPTAGHHVIRVENKGPQLHEMALFRLLPGKTMDDVMKFAQTYQGPIPITALGGAPAMTPGQVEYFPVDLTPGTYVALCFLPDAKDGKPHVAHGMMSTFTIS